MSLTALPAAQANRILRTHQLPYTNGVFDCFGDSVLAMGDADGDGIDDYAVAAPFDGLGFDGGANSGSVRMFSGQTGAELWEASGTAGWTTCSGNIGSDDFGSSLARIADANGDGADEIVVGAPGAGVSVAGCLAERGRTYLLDCATGNVLRAWSGQNQGEQFGFDVGAVNGRVTILAQGGPSPRVVQRDRFNGSLFFNHTVPAGGWDLIDAGDFDGNGAGAEFALSLPFAATPQVLVIDAVTGAQIGPAIVQGTPNQNTFFGWSLAVLPGAGAQGNDVLLIGEPLAQAGAMTPGQLLQADFTVGGTTIFAAGAGSDALGWSVSTNGDADGLVDVLVAALGGPDARLFPGAGGARPCWRAADSPPRGPPPSSAT